MNKTKGCLIANFATVPLEALRVKTSEEYHNELIDAMELEIDTLIAEAAEDARRQAEEQAIANQSAMRGQLRNLLKQGVV
ncbi:hypothetical protein [Enterobacter cloacae]|uniref:hypothetical protein n=1 Tax=Enterobacter cloacae TaxID=550 RepID=UPI000BE6FE64|nr:hypothetical protein [Enterobacter cloacae]PDQ12365.1 hypothetical protein CKK21_25710 [Enterobacter cloacae]